MSQAIVTKFIGPTNHRGARVVAKAWGGKVTIGWEYELGIDGNHHAAATALMRKMGWDETYTLVSGVMPDCTGNAYVMLPKESA